MAFNTYNKDSVNEELTRRLCNNATRYRSCGRCKHNIYSQVFLRRITFRELIGVMASLLLPTINSIATPYYTECLVGCNAQTSTAHKAVGTKVKIICDIGLCRFMAVEWLGYNEFKGVTISTVKEFMNIVTNSTTTDGLVTALNTLYGNYDIWDMNSGTAAYAASCTQDEEY